MVVMGTKGAHGIGDTLFGSNTANLINRCACPVMAIPEKARYTGFNSIVFATHFEQEDVEAVKQLLILFQNSKPTLTLLHVEERDSVDAEAAMDAWFHSLSNVLPASVPLNKVVLNNSDVIDGLHDYLTQNKSNLIVTSTRKRNVFERIFDRSVTRQLAEHEQTPLLALHVAHHTKSQVVF
jgi:nucleotide-binding universal stress UspA family protein